jgi:hypothetical protein
MSAELNKKIDERNHYSVMETTDTKKVNLNDLVKRMQTEERKQKKNNVILSAAAISAVAVFGIILTL